MTDLVVLAPTMDMARDACRALRVSPDRHAMSALNPDAARGLDRPVVIKCGRLDAWLEKVPRRALYYLEATLEPTNPTLVTLEEWR